MRYIVIETCDSESLQESVNVRLLEGFELVGGASVSRIVTVIYDSHGEWKSGEEDYTFIQAMIHKGAGDE